MATWIVERDCNKTTTFTGIFFFFEIGVFVCARYSQGWLRWVWVKKKGRFVRPKRLVTLCTERERDGKNKGIHGGERGGSRRV